MSINANDFEYVYKNYNNIIDDLISKNNRTERENKLLSDALLMDKLVYDSQYGG